MDLFNLQLKINKKLKINESESMWIHSDRVKIKKFNNLNYILEEDQDDCLNFFDHLNWGTTKKSDKDRSRIVPDFDNDIPFKLLGASNSDDYLFSIFHLSLNYDQSYYSKYFETEKLKNYDSVSDYFDPQLRDALNEFIEKENKKPEDLYFRIYNTLNLGQFNLVIASKSGEDITKLFFFLNNKAVTKPIKDKNKSKIQSVIQIDQHFILSKEKLINQVLSSQSDVTLYIHLKKNKKTKPFIDFLFKCSEILNCPKFKYNLKNHELILDINSKLAQYLFGPNLEFLNSFEEIKNQNLIVSEFDLADFQLIDISYKLKSQPRPDIQDYKKFVHDLKKETKNKTMEIKARFKRKTIFHNPAEKRILYQVLKELDQKLNRILNNKYALPFFNFLFYQLDEFKNFIIDQLTKIENDDPNRISTKRFFDYISLLTEALTENQSIIQKITTNTNDDFVNPQNFKLIKSLFELTNFSLDIGLSRTEELKNDFQPRIIPFINITNKLIINSSYIFSDDKRRFVLFEIPKYVVTNYYDYLSHFLHEAAHFFTPLDRSTRNYYFLYTSMSLVANTLIKKNIDDFLDEYFKDSYSRIYSKQNDFFYETWQIFNQYLYERIINNQDFRNIIDIIIKYFYSIYPDYNKNFKDFSDNIIEFIKNAFSSKSHLTRIKKSIEKEIEIILNKYTIDDFLFYLQDHLNRISTEIPLSSEQQEMVSLIFGGCLKTLRNNCKNQTLLKPLDEIDIISLQNTVFYMQQGLRELFCDIYYVNQLYQQDGSVLKYLKVILNLFIITEKELSEISTIERFNEVYEVNFYRFGTLLKRLIKKDDYEIETDFKVILESHQAEFEELLKSKKIKNPQTYAENFIDLINYFYNQSPTYDLAYDRIIQSMVDFSQKIVPNESFYYLRKKLEFIKTLFNVRESETNILKINLTIINTLDALPIYSTKINKIIENTQFEKPFLKLSNKDIEIDININSNPVKDLQDYLQEIKTGDEILGGRHWFRGEISERFHLLPTLFRQPPLYQAPAKVLNEHLNTFLYRSDLGNNSLLDRKSNNPIDIAVSMQHYAVPTHLLDWSNDAMVSLYFAVNPEPNENITLSDLNKQNYSENSIVYLLNPIRLNHARNMLAQLSKEMNATNPNYKKLVNYQMDNKFYPVINLSNNTLLERGKVFEIENLTNYYPGLSKYPDINEIIEEKQKIQFDFNHTIDKNEMYEMDLKEKITRLNESFPIAVYTAQTNLRIRVQKGVFTAFDLLTLPDPNKNNLKQNFYLAYEWAALDIVHLLYLSLRCNLPNPSSIKPFLYPIIIDSNYIKYLQNDLKAIGFRRDHIYPDLENTSKESVKMIREYYDDLN